LVGGEGIDIVEEYANAALQYWGKWKSGVLR